MVCGYMSDEIRISSIHFGDFPGFTSAIFKDRGRQYKCKKILKPTSP